MKKYKNLYRSVKERFMVAIANRNYDLMTIVREETHGHLQGNTLKNQYNSLRNRLIKELHLSNDEVRYVREGIDFSKCITNAPVEIETEMTPIATVEVENKTNTMTEEVVVETETLAVSEDAVTTKEAKMPNLEEMVRNGATYAQCKAAGFNSYQVIKVKRALSSNKASSPEEFLDNKVKEIKDLIWNEYVKRIKDLGPGHVKDAADEYNAVNEKTAKIEAIKKGILDRFQKLEEIAKTLESTNEG